MLSKFFSARSIAVIGASHNPEKIGHIIFKNLLKKFKGKVYPVNVKTEPILGKKVYESVLKIKEKVDLAIICIPAAYVPKAVEECGKKGIKNLVIISGGFSEVGNKQLEEEIAKLKNKYKLRIIGPNVIGIYSPNGLDAIFFSDEKVKKPKLGNISVLTQSGTVGALILDKLAEEGLGVAKFVSYGNALDVNESDLIEYFSKDKKTKVIVGFIEGVRNGKKFVSVVRKVAKKKPIVILKGGKTSFGSRAASSHTASLAGEAKVYSAVFKQFGVVEAKTWEELIDFSKVLSLQPRVKSSSVAIITNGGGFGVLASDEAERQNLELKEPNKKLKKQLAKLLPPHAVIKNPIDLTGDADPERFRKVLKIVLESKVYGGAIVILLLQTPMMDEKIVQVLKEAKKYKKPIVVCATGSYAREISKEIEKVGIPVYPSPERAVKAYAALKI